MIGIRAGAAAALPLLAAAPAARAVPAAGRAVLEVGLTPDAANPAAPRMGDRLTFHAAIRNSAGGAPAEGIIAWLTILRLDTGHEQAIDLEDWSANKALTIASLPSGGVAQSDWSLRLIAPGTYRVLVSAATRDAPVPAIGSGAIFRVAAKPVVDSGRVLPVAIGVPLALGLVLLARLSAGRRAVERQA